MNPNQNTPLTSFLSANAAPSQPSAPPKVGAWDERLAAEVAAEISPGAVKVGQSSSTSSEQSLQNSPGAVKVGQSSSTSSEPSPQISPGAVKVGQSSSIDPATDQDLAGADSADLANGGANSAIFRRADDLLVAAIAAGASQREAARQAGVSESTAHRRWADPNFRRRVLEARSEIRCQAVGRLTSQSNKATETLAKGMDAKSESVRVSAARAVLKIGQELGGRQEENALLIEQLAEFKAALDAARSGQ